MRVSWVLVGLLACGPPPPPPQPTPPPPAVPAPTPTPAPPAPLPPEEDVFIQLTPYREALVKALAATLGGAPTGEVSSREGLRHDVLTFARAGGVRVLTVGFGRREQPYAVGGMPRHVELLADATRGGPEIAAALTRLGRFMHDETRPIDVRFTPFESLRLEEELFGIGFFIFVPVAEVVFGERVVTVLRVIPADEEEYTLIRMRGDGAARAWWREHQGDPSIEARWASVLGAEE